ncbi:hypothetical protein [Massilia jejuensis]
MAPGLGHGAKNVPCDTSTIRTAILHRGGFAVSFFQQNSYAVCIVHARPDRAGSTVMAFAVRAARAAFAFWVEFVRFADRQRAAFARPDSPPVSGMAGHDAPAVRPHHPVSVRSACGHPLAMAMALRATGAR